MLLSIIDLHCPLVCQFVYIVTIPVIVIIVI